MEKLFIPYKEAKALRDLGFNEECLTTYLNGELETKEMFFFTHTFRSHETQEFISAPLYSQAFKWFREKHGLFHHINPLTLQPDGIIAFWTEIKYRNGMSTINRFKTYEKAELACLRKLIDKVKQK